MLCEIPAMQSGKVRPPQLNRKWAEKGGVVVKMKFLVALFMAPIFKQKEIKPY